LGGEGVLGFEHKELLSLEPSLSLCF
jgi:hypothetical protein